MKEAMKKKLGDLLLDSGKITEMQLEAALKKQRITGKRLGELLIEQQIISEHDILSVLEIQLGIPRVFIDFINVEDEAIKSISQGLASKYNLIPVTIHDNKLNVVMSDPLNIFAIDDVQISSGYEVEPLIASSEEIRKAIAKYYSGQFVQKAADDLTKEQVSKRIVSQEAEDSTAFDEVKNAPVVRLIDSIITNAVTASASDIHIEPFEKYVKVRYRIDGELHEVLRSPKETLAALITRIKILANLNIAEKRLPQDGRIFTEVNNKYVDLRVSILPTVNGEKAVIRVLNRDSFLLSKEQLGMGKEDLTKLESIMSRPYGIILVTGPTGSGKTTTLYTILSHINTEDKNIITVEDPVEFLLEGVNQVNVNLKAGLDFASGLRSILRQDPDIVMIGEIRDGETAEIGIRAAITGHVVLSTIHTNDAPSSVIRLIDMGIEPYLIATSLTGVVAQRLVRRVCTNCVEEYEASEYEKKLMEIDLKKPIRISKGKGCPYCNNTGYKGRIGIYEIMELNRNHRDFIIQQHNIDSFRDLCIKNGMKTLKQACVEKVLSGITTMEELMRVTYLKD
jgi:type IV pilus assembly protein PilB